MASHDGLGSCFVAGLGLHAPIAVLGRQALCPEALSCVIIARLGLRQTGLEARRLLVPCPAAAFLVV